MWAIIGSLGLLYLINIPATIVMLTIIRKDKKMQFYMSPCQNKASYSVAIVLSALITHKYNHILFSRLFNFGIFKAQLEKVEKFFSLHLLSFLSFANSLSALGIAGYICYFTMDNINQLFLCGLDVIILTVVNMVMAGANSHKNDDFF